MQIYEPPLQLCANNTLMTATGYFIPIYGQLLNQDQTMLTTLIIYI